MFWLPEVPLASQGSGYMELIGWFLCSRNRLIHSVPENPHYRLQILKLHVILFLFWVGVKGTAADATDAPQPWGLLYNPAMKMTVFSFFLVMEYGGMKLTGENRSTREETCLSATLSTTIPTWTEPGSNPGLRDERPATNRLSHGTAPCYSLTFIIKFLKNNAERNASLITPIICRLSLQFCTSCHCLRIAARYVM